MEIPKEWKPSGSGEEEIDYCLFDLVADTHAGSETITFFNHTRSGNGLAVTNSELAGTLPANQRMLIKSMELLMDVNAATGDSADSLDASATELYINNKLMYSIPSIMLSQTAHRSTNGTAELGGSINNVRFEFDKAIVLQGGEPFKVTVLTGKTAASANDDWTIMLRGRLVRSSG